MFTPSSVDTRPGGLFALFALALLVCCGDPAPEAASEPALPTWTLTETLRLGSEVDGPELFGWVRGIETDSAGRIYIYDRSTQNIRVFNADGTVHATIGREGSGPGELRRAEGIVLADNGELWARDAANGRISMYDADGISTGSWPLRFCSSQGLWAPLPDGRNRMLDIDCVIRAGRADGDAVLAYRLDRSGVDTLGVLPECGSDALREAGTWITRTETRTSYRPIPFAPQPLRTLAPGGDLWCAESSAAYAIAKLPLDGTDTVRIVREVTAEPVTSAERDSVIAVVEAEGREGLDYTRIPSLKPLVERLIVDDQRRLWVQRYQSDGRISFDIYSNDGQPLATADLGAYRTGTFYPLRIRGDQMLMVVINELDAQQVVRFEITR